MLMKFCVQNFKAFQSRLEFNLGSPAAYAFNSEAINSNENIVNKAILYGFNGSGKSVLGLAIFDIITHLTDNEKGLADYDPYINLNSDNSLPAVFEYTFRFEGSILVYSYKKKAIDCLLEENLIIDGHEVIHYDFIQHNGFVSLDGSENLNFLSQDSNISRVKFVYNNTILASNHENQVFKKFFIFVENMLMFYSLDHNRYRGFRSGVEKIDAAIALAGKTKEFEKFLHENNINMDLADGEINGEKTLFAKFGNNLVNFYKVASTGTKSLALFYYWLLQLNRASFVFLDEFDAFYHFELAQFIVNYLKKFYNTQIIFTTHNTDLLSNSILRPDCFFWLHDGIIKSLNELTDKELREAHNLQKMFKARAFNV